MQPAAKKFRQTSIFESFERFERSKKQKEHCSDMSNQQQMRDLMLVAAEQRLSKSSINAGTPNSDGPEEHELVKTSDKKVDLGACCSKDDPEFNGSDEKDECENSPDLFPDQGSSLEEYYTSCSGQSADLFPDFSQNDSESQTTPMEDDDSDDPDQLLYLNRSPDCSIPLPKLEPLENHFIMFSPHIRPGDAPRPYPPQYRDKWDFDHVRMPCSSQNRFPVEDRNGEKRIENRWDLICRSLRRDIASSRDLETAIMAYNSQYVGRWNFDGLHAFINVHLKEEERDHFFETLLPAMIEMALNLPNICTQPAPLLKAGRDRYLTMTQKQIGCLLLNAFFCTFPKRNLPSRNKRIKQRLVYEYSFYPDINFNRLFAGVVNVILPRNAEKLKCLFNYFKRITTEEPIGTVTFHRQSLCEEDLPRWNTSTRGIRTAVIKSSGLIETGGHGMLQVDFANKYVGGGVLGQGCVQEEIRFIICPELIISRLFVERLGFNEVLIITGVEQYNKYSGYSDNFKWEGDFKDTTIRDSWGRRCTQLVAMNATSFHKPVEQFKPYLIKRELNKAYCGFYENASPCNLPAVATGNWGCGAFKGNPNLKFLIQLMAASEAGRSLLYFTFGNKKLKTELQNMYNFLTDKNLAVGDVWRLLEGFAEHVSLYDNTKLDNTKLYDYIYSQFLTKKENSRHKICEKKEETITDSDRIAAEKLLQALACDGSSIESESQDNS